MPTRTPTGTQKWTREKFSRCKPYWLPPPPGGSQNNIIAEIVQYILHPLNQIETTTANHISKMALSSKQAIKCRHAFCLCKLLVHPPNSVCAMVSPKFHICIYWQTSALWPFMSHSPCIISLKMDAFTCTWLPFIWLLWFLVSVNQPIGWPPWNVWLWC